VTAVEARSVKFPSVAQAGRGSARRQAKGHPADRYVVPQDPHLRGASDQLRGATEHPAARYISLFLLVMKSAVEQRRRQVDAVLLACPEEITAPI